jgi:integrase
VGASVSVGVASSRSTSLMRSKSSQASQARVRFASVMEWRQADRATACVCARGEEARRFKPPEKMVNIISPAEWPLLEPNIAITAAISNGKKVLRLPIREELRGDLERALATPGPYLFARDRSKRLPNLVKMLRRACGRAGLVAGHEIRCRSPRCGWSEERGGAAPPPVPDACPRCRREALYRRPIPRKVRFHDLRHSFGTAVVAAGGEGGRAGAPRALRPEDDPRSVRTSPRASSAAW